MNVLAKVETYMLRVVALLILVIGFSTASAQPTQEPVGVDAERGKSLYYDHACYSCHGYGGMSRNLTGNIPLSDGVSGILMSEELFITFLRLRADLNPLLPSEHMPNYGVNSLSDEQARDIYAYIRTFKDDRRAVEDYPAMKKILEAAEASSSTVN